LNEIVRPVANITTIVTPMPRPKFMRAQHFWPTY